MGERFGGASDSGDDAPRADQSPEIDATQAMDMANDIRIKVARPGTLVHDPTAGELIDVAGTSRYGWFEGPTYVAVACTSEGYATRMEITASTPKDTNGSVAVVAREYELIKGERPYYDEASYVMDTATRPPDTAQPGMAPFPLIDAAHDIQQEGDTYALRQTHLRYAEARLLMCTAETRLPHPEE